MSIFITPKQSGVIGKLNKHNSCLLYLTCDEIWTFFLSRPRKLQFSYFFFVSFFSKTCRFEVIYRSTLLARETLCWCLVVAMATIGDWGGWATFWRRRRRSCWRPPGSSGGEAKWCGTALFVGKLCWISWLLFTPRSSRPKEDLVYRC